MVSRNYKNVSSLIDLEKTDRERQPTWKLMQIYVL